MIRKDILERKDDILAWISENRSKRYICEMLSCKPETLNSYLKKMEIKYDGNQNRKGRIIQKIQVPIEKYLNNEKQISSHVLKNKLLKEGIKSRVCEQCGLSEWQNDLIPLELHHIDGNHYNNNLNNLKILCPNCHALTDNYSGKGTKKHEEKQKNIKENRDNYCVDCGKIIRRDSIRCKACSQKAQRKYIRPNRDELKNKIRKYSILSVGNMYGVSDNTIRKWCKYYNLPYKSKDIKRYTDNEWINV